MIGPQQQKKRKGKEKARAQLDGFSEKRFNEEMNSKPSI